MHGISSIILPSGNLPVRGALNNIQTTSNEALRSITEQADQLAYFEAIRQWAAGNCKALGGGKTQGATG
jgi:hypothetical protein